MSGSAAAGAPGALLHGKRGVIMGIANDHSIAWGIAQAMAAHGAQLAWTYQGPAVEGRVRKLAGQLELDGDLVQPCAAEEPEQVAGTLGRLAEALGGLDFLVHAIAWSDRSELRGRYLETSRENFLKTLDISCFSFTSAARAAAAHMDGGGSMITLSYLGAERVVPNYNVMGVAKAALEASIRYLAADLGPQNIRVNGISAGPLRTLSSSAIGGARALFGWARRSAPLRRAITLDDVGGAALYLASDLSAGVSGEIHHVDAGFHAIAIPQPEDGAGEKT